MSLSWFKTLENNEKLNEIFSEDKPFAEAFKCLFENASDAIYILDKKGHFVAVNRKAEELTGFKRRDFEGKSFRKVISLKSLPKAISVFFDVIRGKEVRLELELKTASKKTVLADITSKPLIIKGKIVGTLGIARDITERVQMENELKEVNRKLEMLFETAMEGITVVDAEENLTFVNKAFADMLGYKENELLGMNLQKLVDKKNFRQIKEQTKERKAGKVSRYELVLFSRDGKPHTVQVSASPLWHEKGSFAGSLAIITDVSERRKMEETLRESEEKMRNVLESSPDAITLADLNGNIVDCNQATLDMFGFISKEELIGKSGLSFVADRDRERLMENIKKTLERGSTRNIEYTLVSKYGREFPIEVSASVVKDIAGNPRYFVAIWKDITERKQMQKKLEEYSQQLEELVEKRTSQLREAQEKLIKSERLAAIGQVASMVGHDLRNPLTGIAGATYYLKKKLASEDKTITEMLALIEKDIECSNKIISDLLEYSREMKLEFKETTLRSIMKDALSLVEVPNNIRMLDFTQDEPKIMADVEKIKRVFVNIIKNAIDAMPKGGSLTIKSKESDGNVEIMIADTGTGISKDNLEKIWTPFFTTKAKGMGLGLSICKRIIEAHGGSILVESKLGKGTTFTITIPAAPRTEGGEKIWATVPEFLSLTMTKA
jgi:PAS domain S-box-containing protein